MSTDETAEVSAFLAEVLTIARGLPNVSSAEVVEGDGLPVSFELDLGEAPEGTPPRQLTARADLSALFLALQEVAEAERPESIRTYLTGLLRPEAVIPGWEEASERLFLALRPLGFFLAMAPSRVLARRSLPMLAECVALDFGEALTYVTDTMLEAWGKSIDELFDVARANVETRLEHNLEPLDESAEPRLFRLAAADAYESSRLVSLEWLGKARDALGSDGLVCAAPHRDLLLIAIDASPPTLVRLAELAEKEYADAERPVSPGLYVFTPEGELGPLELVDDHPLASRVRRGHILLADAEYAAQKTKLEEQLAEAEVELHVATHFAAERDGVVFAYCTWSEASMALLPVVDLVAFAFADPEVAPLVVPWPVVAELAQDLWAEVPDLEPKRMRTIAFPDHERLVALAEHAIEM